MSTNSISRERPEGQDRNIGHPMTRHDNVSGEIEARAGSHYVVRWQDGTDQTISVTSFEAAQKAQLADMCTRQSIKRTGDSRVDARAALSRLDADRNDIRAIVASSQNAYSRAQAKRLDINDKTMTDADTDRLVARVRATKFTGTAADGKRIDDRIAGKPENSTPTPQETVAAQVDAMFKAGRRATD